MKEILDVKSIHISDGVLHDQKLKRVSFANGELTFIFDIKLYEQNYIDKSYYEKFKDYKTCTVQAACENDSISCSFMGTKRNGKIVGYYVDLDDFIDCINNKDVQVEYLRVLVSGALEINIEFSFYSPLRKYKNISSVLLCLPADKITFEWE